MTAPLVSRSPANDASICSPVWGTDSTEQPDRVWISIHTAIAALSVRLTMSATPMRRALRIAVRALLIPLRFGLSLMMPRVDLPARSSFLLQERGHDARESFVCPYRGAVLPAVIHQTAGAVAGEVYGNTPDTPVAGRAGGGQEAHRKTQRPRHRAHLVKLVRRVQSESKHGESLSGMLGRVRGEEGELVPAGYARGRPQGEDHHWAFQVQRRQPLAVQCDQGSCGRRLSDTPFVGLGPWRTQTPETQQSARSSAPQHAAPRGIRRLTDRARTHSFPRRLPSNAETAGTRRAWSTSGSARRRRDAGFPSRAASRRDSDTPRCLRYPWCPPGPPDRRSCATGSPAIAGPTAGELHSAGRGSSSPHCRAGSRCRAGPACA